MASESTYGDGEAVHDDRGNLTGYRRALSNVQLEAVQTTEVHRTLENDHTVTEAELPGTVDLYVVIDGGRVRLDSFKASVVHDAIERAQQDKAAAKTAKSSGSS